jgi:starch synthase (maltosyl-transferring)
MRPHWPSLPVANQGMKQGTNARVVIEDISPAIDCGRFPIKRVTGEDVIVEADVFADGHEELSVMLLHRPLGADEWSITRMVHLGNDRWQAAFTVTQIGEYVYTVSGWVDDFATWRQKLLKRLGVQQDVSVDLLIGAELVEQAASRASGADRDSLNLLAIGIREAVSQEQAATIAMDVETLELVRRYPEHAKATTYSPPLRVTVDRQRAAFSAWYEMFPRSCSPVPGQHGTFKDCEERLPYVAGLGFDVLYFPPIHPIGVTSRKGRNNAVQCVEGDPGTPWAIGSVEGGHKSIHPALGTLDDFKSLMARAREFGLEIALDIAFQCSPDHPYVTKHPDWFRWRPDGTIQYAENPPKKYQDIFPLEFENSDRENLWQELRSVVQFWIDQGVRIFRVDNPHTKPFAFWEWLIDSLREWHPDLIFLSEAFTRPKVMARLAKLGFTQSYTYFTWRRTKWELTEYITELTQTELAEYFRPNFWPNTPDILMDYLQEGGRPAFEARLVLAATLSANYGIYGPAFELCINTPREPGSEEYLNSEKYEIKHWNLDAAGSIIPLIRRVNSIRRQSKALQQTRNVRVQHVDNSMLMAYSKWDDATSDCLLVVVNLDPHHVQSGWVTVDLEHAIVPSAEPYEVLDLLSDRAYVWKGPRNYVSLDPASQPAHIFRIDTAGSTTRST